MSLRRTLAGSVLALAALGLLAGCGSSSTEKSTPSQSGAASSAASTSIVRTPDTSTPQKVTGVDATLCQAANAVASAQQTGVGLDQAVKAFDTAYTANQAQLSAAAKATLNGFSVTESTTNQVTQILNYNIWCSGQG